MKKTYNVEYSKGHKGTNIIHVFHDGKPFLSAENMDNRCTEHMLNVLEAEGAKGHRRMGTMVKPTSNGKWTIQGYIPSGIKQLVYNSKDEAEAAIDLALA